MSVLVMGIQVESIGSDRPEFLVKKSIRLLHEEEEEKQEGAEGERGRGGDEERQ